MSASALTNTQVPAVPAEDVAAEVPQADDVEYPEGHWVAQSVSHGDAVEQATGALRHHFREREDVLVAMELVVYYRRGNNRVWLQPDVQVVHGVGRSPSRSTYLVWEEGKPPDFVLEVGSPSTADRDAQHKVGEYASVGVREYWRLDPAGELMAKPLEGYVARAGGYESVPAVAAGGRTWLWSEILGLELRGERRERGTVLVFRDPRTGEEWASADERERRAVEHKRQAAEERASVAEREREIERRRRQAAERGREAAEQRARAADARARALEEQLRALIADTTNPSAGG
ncbi:MAG: Uma2 family endonuclease [Bryobacterales bacterium]|nr:Uma2 family endonuclease [Bryobacterales bacterium]